VPLATVEAEGAEALKRMIPMADLLPGLPGLVLTERGARRAAHGNAIAAAEVAARLGEPALAGGPIRLFDSAGALVAIAEPGEGSTLHPVVVLV